MAENSNINLNLSNGNDFLPVTPDSDILNVTDEDLNRSCQQLENKNLGHSNDVNSNVCRGDFDFSISEAFGKMKLSDSSETKEERGILFSESTAVPLDNRPEENLFNISQDLPPQELSNVSQEPLSSDASAFLSSDASLQNCSNPNFSKEALPSSDENASHLQEPCSPNVSNEALSTSGENILLQNTLDASKEAMLPAENSDLPNENFGIHHGEACATSKEILTSSLVQDACSPNVSKEALLITAGESNQLLQESASFNVSKEALLSPEKSNSLLHETVDINVSKETLLSPKKSDLLNLNSGIHSTSQVTSPCLEMDHITLSQDSKEVAIASSSKTLEQIELKQGMEDALSLPVDNKSVHDSSNQSLSDITPDANNLVPKNIQNDSVGNVNINDNETEKCLDASGSSPKGQSRFQELLNSTMSLVSNFTLSPVNTSDARNDTSSTDNPDLMNCDSLPIKDIPLTVPSAQNYDDCKEVSNFDHGSDQSTSQDNQFKVPALPKEPIKKNVVDPLGEDPQVKSTLVADATSKDSSSDLPVDETKMDLSDNVSSECAENQGFGFLGNTPGIPSELDDEGCLDIPDTVAFTDFKLISSEDNPFKVPDNPKDDEDEFTDAVQFFKDPSCYQFLENIRTSGQPESVIPRSSLCVAFDPLYSKNNRGPLIQSAGPRHPEVKDNGGPINKILDISERESMGNILISFDSPMAAGRATAITSESPVSPLKQYTEEEYQQALKIHELTLQEMYLKQRRELEQELAKVKEDSKKKVESLTALYNAMKITTEEIMEIVWNLKTAEKKMQEKAIEQEKEIETLKENLKTAEEDLQSVENTFSDFHKRYEQCKGMLKSFKNNEISLKEEFINLKTKFNEEEHRYKELLEKANAEVASAKKSSEGTVTVLKAQLKKAELKISGLESDIKKVKIENSQLGGICDDLMDKVSRS